ncbi:MAG: hypothetical protein NWE94_08920 [Candidatus Bathyarchaeota archaeon]|nr:hypothetical protein [Candidatus Bathyarchaeota archaeon]
MKSSQSKTVKLVIFDVEGVLIPKNRFLFEIGKNHSAAQMLRVLLFGFLYGLHAVSLKSALKHIFAGLRGVKLDWLLTVAEKVPIASDAGELFCQLKAQGCKVALISSGIPTAIVSHLAAKLGAEYGFGFDLVLNDGVLTGEIRGDVIERNGKLHLLSKILATEKLSLSDCAVVADDRNNVALFVRETRKVAYNPDFRILIKADTVVTGKLQKILLAVNGQPPQHALLTRNDVLREIIHASGVSVPLLCSLIGVNAVILLIGAVSAVYAASELLRMEKKNLPLISAITRHAASHTELYEFTAAPLYFATGIMLTLLFFKAPVSSAAIAIFTLGDSAASIFGSMLPRKPLPFNKGKTLVGSIAGFIFAFAAGAFFVPPPIALVGAAAAMTIESLPLPVNDNVVMPVCTAVILAFII